jgi:hypothetical protein
MTTPDKTATVALTLCHSCIAEVPASDIYCRKCGVRQRAGAVTGENWNESKTKHLQQGESGYQTISSPLVNQLTQAVAVKASTLNGNRFGIRLVAALVTIPIWLLIILLSPLDAYTAAKAVSSQTH